MKSEIPTFAYIKRKIKRDLVMFGAGFSAQEVYEEHIKDLLAMCRTYEKAANEWMRECEKLKQKYEPRELAFAGE